MSMNFKCISLLRKNKLKIIHEDINVNLDDKKVLIKILYSGICRSQLMEIDMMRGKDKYLPHLLGHEAIGIVKKIGKKIQKVKIGDKVVLSWIKGKGISSKGGKFNFRNKQEINYGPISTLSNYSIISEDRCFKVYKNFPNKIGSFFGCSILTGAGMVFNHTKILKKHNVAIIGIGGIGLAALLALKCLGKKDVLIIENNKNRYKLIKRMGFKNILSSNEKNFQSKIKKISKNKLYDVCFEAGGKTYTIELGMSILNDSGKLIFASHPDSKKKIRIDPHDLIKGKQIIGSWGGNSKPDKDIVKFYNLYKKNNLFKFLKPKIYPFNNIKKAIEDFRKGRTLRPVIKM
jgi:S-(hydroxymethyl)glutathione dehydrogenase/alcohol dehydrogenase